MQWWCLGIFIERDIIFEGHGSSLECDLIDWGWHIGWFAISEHNQRVLAIIIEGRVEREKIEWDILDKLGEGDVLIDYEGCLPIARQWDIA